MDDLIKSVMLDVIDDLVKEFANNGGNSYFVIDGQEYRTDTGYAMEGIELFAEKLKERASKEIEHPKGEWIANGDIPTECPFCGEDWDKYVFGEVWYTGELPNFCPNCGEDMRGEEDARTENN